MKVNKIAPDGAGVECSLGVSEVMSSIPGLVIPKTSKVALLAKRLIFKGTSKTKEIWSVYLLSTVKCDQVGSYINMPMI